MTATILSEFVALDPEDMFHPAMLNAYATGAICLSFLLLI